MMNRPILGLVENVSIVNGNKQKKVKARVDTGATKSSMDVSLASDLQLGPIIRKKEVKSAHGTTVRPVIRATIVIDGIEIEGEFTLAQRSHMTYKVLVGQNVLKKGRFMVDPLK
jgi:hypothetical protein